MVSGLVQATIFLYINSYTVQHRGMSIVAEKNDYHVHCVSRFQWLFRPHYVFGDFRRSAKPRDRRPNAPPGLIFCPQLHLQPSRFQDLAVENETQIEEAKEVEMHLRR